MRSPEIEAQCLVINDMTEAIFYLREVANHDEEHHKCPDTALVLRKIARYLENLNS